MKLKKLFGNWNNAIKTFPVSHILLVTISAIWIGNIEGILSDHFSYRILVALAFAFLLSCLGPIIQIHSNLKNKNTINRILQISSLILGGIYYFILTRIKNVFNATYSEGLLYFGVIILAVILIPLLIAILHKKEEPKIWFSWNSLIVSLIFGGIAGSIVRGGIAGAFGSIEALFNINIISERYSYVGVLSEILLAGSFVFNYYLTLAEGINNKSEFKINPSRIRRIFGSFIFLPLALIYLLIFGAYGIKILVTGVWPNGIIVWLGIGYFSLGILSAYLIYPEKTKIHEIIYKILYISFILIAFMMIGAISQRINQYGITINRRFICFMIAFIILHSVLSLIFPKKRLISFISLLFILTLLALYGPVSGQNISYKSQVNKLQNILSKENITLPLSESSLKDLDEKSQTTILGIVEELTEKYNKDKVYNKIISYDYDDVHRYSARLELRSYLGVTATDSDYYNDYTSFSYRQRNDNKVGIDIDGYLKLYAIDDAYDETSDNILKLNIDNQEYNIDLSTYIPELLEKAKIYRKYDRTDEEKKEINKPALILDGDNYRLIITGFYGEKNITSGEAQIKNIQGYILVK